MSYQFILYRFAIELIQISENPLLRGPGVCFINMFSMANWYYASFPKNQAVIAHCRMNFRKLFFHDKSAQSVKSVYSRGSDSIIIVISVIRASKHGNQIIRQITIQTGACLNR